MNTKGRGGFSIQGGRGGVKIHNPRTKPPANINTLPPLPRTKSLAPKNNPSTSTICTTSEKVQAIRGKEKISSDTNLVDIQVTHQNPLFIPPNMHLKTHPPDTHTKTFDMDTDLETLHDTTIQVDDVADHHITKALEANPANVDDSPSPMDPS